LPILIAAYLINYLDRTSVSVAALVMNRDLNLSATQFGFGAGVFFVGYCLFEIPSNIALYKYGARLWLMRIMITWGLASAATAFVVGPRSFYFVRFLLGVAEAGFFPGVIYFLSSWFPKEYRARILAWFIIGIPASSLIGTPVAGLLLGLNGVAGLAGWKWMFLIVSAPAVIAGCMIPRLLADTPEQATWLTQDERQTMRSMLDAEPKTTGHASFRGIVGNPSILLLAATQFGFLVVSYGIGIWLPQILKRQDLSNFKVTLLSALPYLVAIVGQVVWATYSDKRDSPVLNVVLSLLLGAGGLVLSIEGHFFGARLLGIVLAILGVNAARAIFWAIPPQYLTGSAAAVGFAFINTLGTVGGFVGPYTIGVLKDVTGSFDAGLVGMAVLMVLTAATAASLRLVKGSPACVGDAHA
jgi:MFS family permease